MEMGDAKTQRRLDSALASSNRVSALQQLLQELKREQTGSQNAMFGNEFLDGVSDQRMLRVSLLQVKKVEAILRQIQVTAPPPRRDSPVIAKPPAQNPKPPAAAPPPRRIPPVRVSVEAQRVEEPRVEEPRVEEPRVEAPREPAKKPNLPPKPEVSPEGSVIADRPNPETVSSRLPTLSLEAFFKLPIHAEGESEELTQESYFLSLSPEQQLQFVISLDSDQQKEFFENHAALIVRDLPWLAEQTEELTETQKLRLEQLEIFTAFVQAFSDSLEGEGNSTMATINRWIASMPLGRRIVDPKELKENMDEFLKRKKEVAIAIMEGKPLSEILKEDPLLENLQAMNTEEEKVLPDIQNKDQLNAFRLRVAKWTQDSEGAGHSQGAKDILFGGFSGKFETLSESIKNGGEGFTELKTEAEKEG